MLGRVLTTLQNSRPTIWRQRASLPHKHPAFSTRRQLRLLLFLLGLAVLLGFLAGVPDDGCRAVHDHVAELGIEVTLINGLVQMYSSAVAAARRHG